MAGAASASKSGSADAMEALGVNINSRRRRSRSASRTWAWASCSRPTTTRHEERGPGAQKLGVHHLQHPGAADQPGERAQHPDGRVPRKTWSGIQVRALQRLGAEHALVVYGRDGMDEDQPGRQPLVGELKRRGAREYEIHPRTLACRWRYARALKRREPDQSKGHAAAVLQGEEGPRGHRLPERRRRTPPMWPNGIPMAEGCRPCGRLASGAALVAGGAHAKSQRLAAMVINGLTWTPHLADAGTWIALGVSLPCSSGRPVMHQVFPPGGETGARIDHCNRKAARHERTS